MRPIRGLIFTALLLVTIGVASYHAGSIAKPQGLVRESSASGIFIPKDKAGINQLILKGSAFARGRFAGELTKHLLLQQENVLVEQLSKWIPNQGVMQTLIIIASNYFRGLDQYFEKWATDEMFGVSLSAPATFDYLADGFTRQIAYHGLHEVGQMMVDQGGENMGCTVVATPYEGSWILGRNFDFEGGAIFDDEKILKWVFPDQGNAYVSVIWAGMVGAVTGVNKNGLYISINAAGTEDFRRVGTPSTLVLTKILQFANNADEALEIFRNETMFITDIFVMVDRESGRAFRIEKSPKRTQIEELKAPFVVANHLMSPAFANDSVNLKRKSELTSEYRFNRGQALLNHLRPSQAKTSRDAELAILSIMRDKGEADGLPLSLGNRRAIDALIATHSVIYNAKDNQFFVSRGPALSKEFLGYDLTRSFKEQTPVRVVDLPADIQVTGVELGHIRESAKSVEKAIAILKGGKCDEAGTLLQTAGQLYDKSSQYQNGLGDWQSCLGKRNDAVAAWSKALALQPAYARDIRDLKRKLAQ